MATVRTYAPRLLAGFGLAALVASVGLFAASRPARTAGGPRPGTTSTTPLPMTDLGSPDQQPFQMTLSPRSTTSRTATESYRVPTSKRLVIDYYSAQLTQYPAGGYASLYLITTVGGSTAYYKVVPPEGSTVPNSQVTHIYADPGTLISAEVVQSSGTSCGGNEILSGHYVTVR